jgi:rRNA small subunit pseudouridine methyltransferase Nep1
MSEESWHEAPTQGQPVVLQQSRKLIIILENACLEAASVNRYDNKSQLLNCDEHQSILKKWGRDIAEARPDIVHQVRDRNKRGKSKPINNKGVQKKKSVFWLC